MNKPAFILEGRELLASALHAQLLSRRRGTFEHDVKNVMHGLTSGTELLDKALTTKTARIAPAECLRLLQQQLERAQDTLNRMLNEIAPEEVAPADVELGALIEECHRDLRHQLQRLEFKTEIEPRLIVRAQQPQLKNAFLSLLFEAIDCAPVHSALTVQAAADSDRRARVEIRHSHSQSTDSSTLAIVGELLQEQGGVLEITSSEAHRHIALLLPLAPQSPERAQMRRVVIVDANRDAADSLAMLIELDGFAAVAAYDIQTAQQQGRALHADLFVIDVDGSIDSETLVRTLRAESPGVRLIGLSHTPGASASSVEVQLRKPLDCAALRACLGEH